MKAFALKSGSPRETPPSSLYKYLAPERVEDTLKAGNFKFTQMANTNDIFEVRKTFKRIAGPRFYQMIADMQSEMSSKEKLEARLVETLAKRMGRKPSRSERRTALAAFYREGMDKQFREQLAKGASDFAKHLNSEEAHDMLMEMFGKDMLCFSLSEGYGISPMWTHYAGTHSGFVIEVATDHEWFKNKDDKSKSRLHKVVYADGIMEELLENPEATFGSKTTDWSYEKEWRMYCGPKDIEKTIAAQPDPIHLIAFPPNLIKSVIVGSRASLETIEHIKSVVGRGYPHASVLKAVPNGNTSLMDLISL